MDALLVVFYWSFLCEGQGSYQRTCCWEPDPGVWGWRAWCKLLCPCVWSEGDLGALLCNESLAQASVHVPVEIERVLDECDEPIACVAGASSRRIGVVK